MMTSENSRLVSMLDRGDVRHVNRLFAAADDFRREVHDAGRGDQHLGREEAVTARQPAGAEDVALGERPALSPEKPPAE